MVGESGRFAGDADQEEAAADTEEPIVDAESIDEQSGELDAENGPVDAGAGRDGKLDARADARDVRAADGPRDVLPGTGDAKDAGQPQPDLPTDPAKEPDLPIGTPDLPVDPRPAEPRADSAPDAPLLSDVPALGDVPLLADTSADQRSDARDSPRELVMDARDGADDADTGVGEIDSSPQDVGDDAITSCPADQLLCDGVCVTSGSDPHNCGACGRTCASGVCMSGQCLTCRTLETACGTTCVNLFTDPNNCGACGTICPDGVCNNKHCETAGTGRVILIGHDFYSHRASMDFVLANAVFLWPLPSVRLLVYVGTADATAVAAADAAIAWRAAAMNRSCERIETTDTNLPTDVMDSDVLLIYSQVGAIDADLEHLGADWHTALNGFVTNGGTVIVLDGGSQSNAGTYQILKEAGLINLTAQTSVSGKTCTVAARGDSLAAGLSQSYLCDPNSVNFTGSEAASVVEADGASVVIHKVF
jgi:hypothetical protein